MTTGTKSLLFGVHQFIWHPITVARGWRQLYGKWPSFWESVAIFVHDWGYWGCKTMDGEDGKMHPLVGAKVAWKLHRFFNPHAHPYNRHALMRLCLFHSRYLAAKWTDEPSKLCWADKMSPVFDPPWFYLLRARLTGELSEYRANAKNNVPAFFSDLSWYLWFRLKSIQEVKERCKESHRA